MAQNEHASKKIKVSEDCTSVYKKLSEQLSDIQASFNERLLKLENKLDTLTSLSTCKESLKVNMRKEKDSDHKCCSEVLSKLSVIEQLLKSVSGLSQIVSGNGLKGSGNAQPSEDILSPVVLLPTNKPPAQVEAQLGLDSSIQVITLNNESDYPDGCWLGDESNPEARVRVPITSSQLLLINSSCTTPEKMAIVLLDYLFPQEIQAVSNLSGKGRHCKKQLDPLKIYAIRSHLLYKFSITERDWYRIKQNIDSKCRTAWRKKARGLPLNASKNVSPANSHSDSSVLSNDSVVLCGPFVREDTTTEVPLALCTVWGEKVLRTNRGHFKVVRTTTDQLPKLQEGHTIKVYTDEDLTEYLPSQLFSIEDSDSYTLTDCCEQTLTIVTDTGEVNVLSTDSLSDDPVKLQ